MGVQRGEVIWLRLYSEEVFGQRFFFVFIFLVLGEVFIRRFDIDFWKQCVNDLKREFIGSLEKNFFCIIRFLFYVVRTQFVVQKIFVYYR